MGSTTNLSPTFPPIAVPPVSTPVASPTTNPPTSNPTGKPTAKPTAQPSAMPTRSPTRNPTPNCRNNEQLLTVEIKTDRKNSETKFNIKKRNNKQRFKELILKKNRFTRN